MPDEVIADPVQKGGGARVAAIFFQRDEMFTCCLSSNNS
jgi:hypothetical protein